MCLFPVCLWRRRSSVYALGIVVINPTKHGASAPKVCKLSQDKYSLVENDSLVFTWAAKI